MYRKYLNLSWQCVKGVYHQQQPQALVNYENHTMKRWAGHSKWQNIKHIKTLTDKTKSLNFGKHSHKIIMAVKEGGPDVHLNFKLKALVEEARKMNMPNKTIEKSISRALVAAEKPYWLIYSGPKGIVMASEIITENVGNGQSKVGYVAKKYGFKLEKNTQEFITEKGIVISEPSKASENAFDKALEDGIEVGVEDVFENDDKTFIFACYPNQVHTVSDKLASKGYKIQSANTEVQFSTYVNINESDSDMIKNFTEKLQNIDDVLRVDYNIVENE